jgi:hypothetical protein
VSALFIYFIVSTRTSLHHDIVRSVTHFVAQIFAYCISAVVGGTMFSLWWRMGVTGRQSVWRLHGWYSGLMMLGSIFGAFTWSAYMMYLLRSFESSKISDAVSPVKYSLAASSLNWRSAFTVTYAVEFLCLSAAKLMVLDRMVAFALLRMDVSATQRWLLGGRVVMMLVVAGNVAGLIGNIIASAFFAKAAQLTNHASLPDATREAQNAASVASVQNFCEVVVLLLIVASFVATGVFCARTIRSGLLSVDASSEAASAGRSIRLHIAGTSAFIFVAFLLRAVHSIMFAVAEQLQNFSADCPASNGNFCDSCYNVYMHMAIWMGYTPQFRLIVILISSPVALMVAMWGMTSKGTLVRIVNAARSQGSETL